MKKPELEFKRVEEILKDGPYKSIKDIVKRGSLYFKQNPILVQNDITYSYEQLWKDLKALGGGLLSKYKNRRIAIMADNSYNYLLCVMAISSGVGIDVPLEKDAPKETIKKFFELADVDTVICSEYLVKKLQEIKQEYPNLKDIITIDKKAENCDYLGDIMNSSKEEQDQFDNLEVDLEKPCEILFTSGTTGANKPVVMTQKNLVANTMHCLNSITAVGENTSMSVLPMHHAAEVHTHVIPRIANGRLTYICTSMKNIARDLNKYKPNIVTVVPMIINMFYQNIVEGAKKEGKYNKMLKGIKLCNALLNIGIDIRKKLFQGIIDKFGGNLNQIVSGAAPLNPEVVKAMRGLGIYIVNGYGISECGPLISMNTNTFKDTKSVGYPCNGVKVKVIDKDENGVGELCVKSDAVFKEYYKNEKDTKMVFTEDGYFKTGDYCTLSKDNKITICGRKKNIILLDNGKNIYPEEVEIAIKNSIPYITEIVVYSENCEIKGKSLQKICANIYCKDYEIDEKQLQEDFRKANTNLSSYKRVDWVVVSKEEFPKTATKKIIRDKVVSQHDCKKGIII